MPRAGLRGASVKDEAASWARVLFISFPRVELTLLVVAGFVRCFCDDPAVQLPFLLACLFTIGGYALIALGVALWYVRTRKEG